MRDIQKLIVDTKATLHDLLALMDQTAQGILLLVDDQGRLQRTITDGDLRRLVLAETPMNTANPLPPKTPLTAPQGTADSTLLKQMQDDKINHMPLVDDAGRPIGLVHLRDLEAPILLSTPHMGEEELAFINQAFATNWIAPLGPNVDAFEAELAAHVGTRYAAAVSSGTAAIHLGLRLLGVGQGDRVFCSTLTFAASANPIVYQGAEPIFIDSETQSWNMCPKALVRAFETAAHEGWMPKAVVVVNLYGQSADMDPIMALCNKYGVPMLEDAAESLGATYKGRASGTFGKIGIYSFNGNKIITTSGGGMLISDDEALVKKARFLATQARDPAPHYQHSEIGYNYRMSNILAGVGRGQLKVLEKRVEARRAVFDAYVKALADISTLEWMPQPTWSFSNRWLTTATVTKDAPITSAGLIEKLAEAKIEARPVWKPMHLQPVFAHCRYFTAEEGSSVADDLFARGICLPSGSNMTAQQQGRVIEVLQILMSPTTPNRDLG